MFLKPFPKPLPNLQINDALKGKLIPTAALLCSTIHKTTWVNLLFSAGLQALTKQSNEFRKKKNKSLYSSLTDNAPTSGKFPTSISSKRQSRSKSSISKSILHCPSRRKAILNQVSLVSRYCLALQVLSASTVYNLVQQDTLSSKTDISFQRRNILISHTHLNNRCFNLTNNNKKKDSEKANRD